MEVFNYVKTSRFATPVHDLTKQILCQFKRFQRSRYWHFLLIALMFCLAVCGETLSALYSQFMSNLLIHLYLIVGSFLIAILGLLIVPQGVSTLTMIFIALIMFVLISLFVVSALFIKEQTETKQDMGIDKLKPLARVLLILEQLYHVKSISDFIKVLVTIWATIPEEDIEKWFSMISIVYGISKDRLLKLATSSENSYPSADFEHSFVEGLGNFNHLLKSGRLFQSSKLLQSTRKLGSFLVCTSLGKCIGLNINTENFDQIWVRSVKQEYALQTWDNFVLFLSETAVEFLTTGYKLYLGQDLRDALLGESHILSWFKRFDALMERIHSASTGATVDFQEVCNTADQLLIDSRYIKPGEMAAPFKSAQSELQRRIMKLRTDLANCGTRKLPFGVLLYGPSGIGKSSITNHIFEMYASYTKKYNPGIKWDPKTCKYTRGIETFWNGYNFQWALVLDDVAWEAKQRLKTAQQTTINEVIQIMNNVAYSTDQAALEDKGTKPLMAKCVVATTNVKDMNAWIVAETPSAILRRFPIVVTPLVKEEYRKPNSLMLDTLKAQGNTDLWDFIVEHVVVEEVDGRFMTVHKRQTFDGKDTANLFQFNLHMRYQMQLHEQTQHVVQELNEQVHETCEHGLIGFMCETCHSAYATMGSSSPPLLPWFPAFFNKLGLVIYKIVFKACFRTMYYSTSYYNYATEYYKEKQQHPIVLAAGALLVVLTVYNFWHRYSAIATMGNSVSAIKNIWAKDQSDDFDIIGAPRTSTLGDVAAVINKRSIFQLYVTSGDFKGNVRCVGVKGQWYATVSHMFPKGYDSFNITIDHGDQDQPLVYRRCCTIMAKDIRVDRTNDVAFFTHPTLDYVRDISKFLVDGQPTQTKGILHWLPIGSKVTRSYPLSIVGIGRETMRYATHGVTYYTRHRAVYDPAIPNFPKLGVGCCGSPISCSSPQGSYIYGFISCMSYSNKTLMGISRLSKSAVDDLPSHISAGENEYFCTSSVLGSPQPLHESSPLRHESIDGRAIPLVSFDGRRKHFESSTIISPIKEDVERYYGEMSQYGPPLMRGRREEDGSWTDPMVLNIDKRVHTTDPHDLTIMQECIDSIVEDYSEVLDFSAIVPIGNKEALNGLDGEPFINRIPRATSGGWRFPGKKSKYVVQVNGEDELAPEVVEWVNYIESCYLKGERANVMFDANLKDEAVSAEKIKVGKTRMFTASPFDFTVVVRKKFLTLSSEIMKHNIETGIAAGMNCYADWNKLYHALHCEPSRVGRLAAGDHSGFDTSMGPLRISAAMEVLTRLCKKSKNFSTDDILIMKGITADLCFPVVNINGDAVQFFGTNCSGHALTLLVNSVVNILDMRYTYRVHTKLPLSTFKTNVSLFVMGDDNIFSVREGIDFGHTIVQKEMQKLGLKYTMADKESESVNFLPIEKVDFLKRKFLPITDDLVLCPLDENSIFKMLTTITQSKRVTMEEQLGDIISQASREWVMHGKEIYEQRMLGLEVILSKHPHLRIYLAPLYGAPFEVAIREITGKAYPGYDYSSVDNEEPRYEDCIPTGSFALQKDIVMSVAISPLLEEKIKRRFLGVYRPWVVGMIFGISESFVTRSHHLQRIFFHALYGYLSYEQGVAGHALFNYGVVIMEPIDNVYRTFAGCILGAVLYLVWRLHRFDFDVEIYCRIHYALNFSANCLYWSLLASLFQSLISFVASYFIFDY